MRVAVGRRRAAATSRRCREDTRASQLPDPHIGKDGFLDVFGRPARESSCECERRTDFSLPQALNLVNGKTISDAVADAKGRVAKLVLSGKSDDAMVEELYLAALEPPARRRPKRETRRDVSFEWPAASRARAGSAVGAAQQQSVSVQLLSTEGLRIMLNHSWTSRLHTAKDPRAANCCASAPSA